MKIRFLAYFEGKNNNTLSILMAIQYIAFPFLDVKIEKKKIGFFSRQGYIYCTAFPFLDLKIEKNENQIFDLF